MNEKFKRINNTLKILSLIGILFALLSCSQRINLNMLDISPIVYEIPKVYNPPKVILNCKVEVLTTKRFNTRQYKKEMIANFNKTNASSNSKKSQKGLLCIPDISSGQIIVYNNNGEKAIEISIDNNQITQILINGFSYAHGKFESRCINNCMAYFLANGIITVEDSNTLYFERKIDKIEDGGLKVTTKRHITGSRPKQLNYSVEIVDVDRYYYEVYEKEYDNIRSYSPTNYNPQDYEPNGRLVSLKYLEEDEKPMSPFDILFLDNPDMLFFKSDFIEKGHRWYLALTSPEYSESHCKGEFFTTNDDFKTIHYKGAFEANFDSLSVRFHCFLNYTNDKYYTYELVIDEFGEVFIKNDSVPSEEHNHLNPITYSIYKPDYYRNIEAELKEIIKKRIETEERNWLRRRSYYTGSKFNEDDWIYQSCHTCGGTGKMAQSGMGVVLGYMTCPQCGGSGTISINKHLFH